MLRRTARFAGPARSADSWNVSMHKFTAAKDEAANLGANPGLLGPRYPLGEIDLHRQDANVGRSGLQMRVDPIANLGLAAPRDNRSLLRNHLLNEQSVSLVGRPPRRKPRFRFPNDLRTEPILLPSLDSDIRVAFDRILELAGIRPNILAEVDDMAMLRLLAREREGVTLVPPIVVRDELKAGILIEYCRIPEVTEKFYAIVQKRRFPNQLLARILKVASDP